MEIKLTTGGKITFSFLSFLILYIASFAIDKPMLRTALAYWVGLFGAALIAYVITTLYEIYKDRKQSKQPDEIIFRFYDPKIVKDTRFIDNTDQILVIKSNDHIFIGIGDSIIMQNQVIHTVTQIKIISGFNVSHISKNKFIDIELYDGAYMLNVSSISKIENCDITIAEMTKW